MSSKSSLKQHDASSAGDTRSARSTATGRSTVASGSVASTMTTSARGTAKATRTAPPAMMGGREKLQLIRNALTRLQYVCERQQHTAALDLVDEEDVVAFFTALRPKLELLLHNPEKLGSPAGGGPAALPYIAAEVRALMAECARVQQAVADSVVEEGDVVYSGLQASFLHEAARELAELDELLSHRAGEMPSRINTDLLQDMVSYHIKEFDAFAGHHMRHFIEDLRQQGAAFVAEVRGVFSGHARAQGYCGFELVDVCIGVRPTQCAHMVIEHALQRLVKLQDRVFSAEKVTPAADDPSIEIFADVVKQKRMLQLMKERVTEAFQSLVKLREEWRRQEKELFRDAVAGKHRLDTIVQQKRAEEIQVVAQAREIHDEIMRAYLPFTGPQYHRRYGETYSQPCHLRVAARFASAEGDDYEPVVLHTFVPEFRALMRQHQIPFSRHVDYATLVPNDQLLWLDYGDVPEMVKGERCVLRGADPRADHFRALEEQKEVGGYFIIRGGERILRALVMQRCNVALNVERTQYAKEGTNFSPRAVVLRSRLESGITMMNFLYYAFDGKVVLSFSRGEKMHMALPMLLFALHPGNVTPAQLLRLLTVGMPGEGSHRARVEALLQHHQQLPYGHLTHYLEYITMIGALVREYCHSRHRPELIPQLLLGDRQCQHDAWFGLYLLRHHILPHLNVSAATPDLAPNATAEEMSAWLPPALLGELESKFHALLQMARQLYLFIDGKQANQGNDVLAYQDIFTSAQIFMAAFKSSIALSLKTYAQRLSMRFSSGDSFRSVMALRTANTLDATQASETLRRAQELYTQNLDSYKHANIINSLLSIGALSIADDVERDYYTPQLTGWVVMADHLNFYRFFEILRCVHRGKVIADMRSSEVRRYRCESYGFVCMVHSPDGTDCGVVNFLSVSTIMSSSLTDPRQAKRLLEWIAEDLPRLRTPGQCGLDDCLLGTVPVWLEGRLLGYATPQEAARAAHQLRLRKALIDATKVSANGLPLRDSLEDLQLVEVVYVPPMGKDPPGLYVFAGAGRLMRPVQKIESREVRALQGVAANAADVLPFPLTYVGSWEQSWLDVAGVASELTDGVVQLGRKYEYMEQSGSNIISFTSCTIPFFEYNCSPRNLFQCGLSKQSAGTQMQSAAWRREAKLFRMYSPQRYISRTLPMDVLDLDDVNLGVNAVVAILAYTGYDMDDAVILNRTAAARGMLNAGITIAKIVTASEKAAKGETFVFQNLLQSGSRREPDLQPNGLPYRRSPSAADHQGPSLTAAAPIYCLARREETVDPVTNQRVFEYSRHRVVRWADLDKGESGWVHHVVPLAFDGPDPSSVLFVFRIPRPPTVGDKFSSRHGQKGTLPLHISAVDLPFSTRSGITPDIIINPHAFPSRMTVGMVLEMMSAKIGAIEGRFMDDSAWRLSDERPRAAAELGEALVRHGYNRYGRETLIDGISGEEMEAEVFMGVAGYQRLRHMVSDKWQARARTDGTRHRAVAKTGQPVKGRKKHGGVRVGEMERDALLSYGISEVVMDRLLHVSDETLAFCCPRCGGLLSIYETRASVHSTAKVCHVCSAGVREGTDCIAMIEIPQVFRLWASELTGIGIRVAFKVS